MISQDVLVVAESGPCKGHPCDNCATCQRGRCCRNDNPGYRLPETGEWDGPLYGELGVLEEFNGKLTCHLCGEAYRSVGGHAWHTHNVTADEYRAIVGLAYTRALCVESMSTALSTKAQARYQNDEDLRRAAIQRIRSATPEQMYGVQRGRKQRLGVKHSELWQKAVATRAAKKTGVPRDQATRDKIGAKAKARGYTPHMREHNEARLATRREVACSYCGKSCVKKASRVFGTNFCDKRCHDAYVRRHREQGFCVNGHPVEGNTRLYRGRPICQICRHEIKRRYEQRHAGKANPDDEATQ